MVRRWIRRALAWAGDKIAGRSPADIWPDHHDEEDEVPMPPTHVTISSAGARLRDVRPPESARAEQEPVLEGSIQARVAAARGGRQ